MSGSMLWPAGAAAETVAVIGWVLFAGAALIFAGVMLLLARALQRREPPRRMRPALWLIGGGVVFPAVVLSALLGWSLHTSARLAQPAPPGAMVVSVTGHMWWWEVRYRDPAGGADIALANELRLPVGSAVVIGVNSADVIHSLWVPALAGKVDAVPGRVNQLVLSATRPGVFRGPCAEYCGQQHARMELRVVAQPPAEFEAWLAAQAKPAAEPETALQRQGRQAFVAMRCVSCHVVRGLAQPGIDPVSGTPSVGTALAQPGIDPVPGTPSAGRGPDLTHVGSRRQLGAGTLRNDAAGRVAWIAGVQHLKPGARMPSFDQLDAPTLQGLSAYLGSLQ